MADLIKSQYLDATGLGVFYGLIKDQWVNADQEQYTKITGEYTDAISAAQKVIWGGESAPAEIGNLQAAEDAIKKNASDIAELVEALTTEVELRAQEDAKLLGTSEDESGKATIHGALNAVTEEATARDNADKAIIGEDGDQSKSTITGLAYNLDKEVGELDAEDFRLAGLISDETTARGEAIAAEATAREEAIAAEATARGEAIAAEAKAREDAIAAEAKAREDADSALDLRVDALEAGAMDPDWLSDNWLIGNVDNASIVTVNGAEKTITLPNGESKNYTPKLLKASLSLSRTADNKIQLTSGSIDASGQLINYGSIDLSEIVLDRVLTAGSVIYDKNDVDPEEGYVMAEGLAYPYIVFTIDTIKDTDGDTTVAGQEYIRVSVKDLVDEYKAEGDVEIVRTDVPGEQPKKTIKLTQAFLDRIGKIETDLTDEVERATGVENKLTEDLAAEVERATETEAALLGVTGDAAGTATIHGALNAIAAEKARAEGAEGEISENLTTTASDIRNEFTTADAQIRNDFTTADAQIRNDFTTADTALGKRIDDANDAIAAEVERAEGAEGELDERIGALEAGQLDISSMSKIWKIHDVDGVTTVSIEGEEKEYETADGKKHKYTPTLVKTNLTLVQKGTDSLENNHIIELQDGSKTSHGSIDLRDIIEAIPTETINSICGVGTEEPEAGA